MPSARFLSVAMMAVLTFTVPLATSLWADESTPAGYRPYVLRHATADSVAPKLREFLDGVSGQGEMLIDRQGNRILLKGPDEAHRMAGEYLKTVDSPPRSDSGPNGDGRSVIRGYAVEPASLGQAVERLQKRFADKPSVRVVADKRTSQIIVAATPEIQKQIAGLLGPSEDQVGPVESAPGGPELRGEQQLRVSNRLPDKATPTTLDPRRVNLPAQGARDGHQLQHSSWRDFEDLLREIWG